MSLGTILLVLLILMVIGALPAWLHSRGWGRLPDKKTTPHEPFFVLIDDGNPYVSIDS